MSSTDKSQQMAINSHEFDEQAHKQAKILKAFLGTTKHYFGDLSQLFKGVNDPRNPNQITYPLASLMFTGILMFLCHLGARRQIKATLRDNSPSQAKFKELFGVHARGSVWPGREPDPQEGAGPLAVVEALFDGSH
jgi:hypothetical protein